VGLNQTTSTSLGSILLSSTLGGTCEINSTLIRLIPFNAGAGTVPTFNTVISKNGASGLLIGVYSNINVASTATGASMPISGFLKIKQWNSIPFSSGTLAGISATSTGVDTEGWLEIVGDEAGTCTVNRLNLFKIRGSYFYLGTTNGDRSTTYQIPSSGTLQYHAGVEVETDIGTGMYEFYPCSGAILATSNASATDSYRGKQCWISNTGLLRFGSDGTNSTGGYIVPSGRKIRIPNIFLSNCTTAARTNNALPNASLGTRYEFVTTGGGVIDLNGSSCSWYLNLNQPYSISLKNINICTGLVITEVAQPLIIDNLNVGLEASNSQISLTLNLCFAGGSITNMNLFRAFQSTSTSYVSSFSDINGFTFINCSFESGVKASNAGAASIALIRAVDCSFTNTKLGGGRVVLSTCNGVIFKNTGYYDNPGNINTTASSPMYMFDVITNSINCILDEIHFGGLNLTQPYNGILNVGAAGCSNITLRNIGTYNSPLSLGKPRVDDKSWTRTTTTSTVTDNSHGYAVNDTIYVVISNDTSTIIVGAKTITAVTINTFNFTCLNVGSTNGTISYFGTKCANVFLLATSAAANGVKIQRVYAPHTRVNLYTTDNSSKNITMENVFSDYLNAPLIAMLNGYSKGVSGTPPLTPQQAVYGTHWFNGYVVDVASSTTGQSYSRNTTVCTITSPGHSLRTGMLIHISSTTEPTTFTSAFYTITALTSSTFTIVVANAGTTSGLIDYRVANGRIGLVMNEASPDTLDRYSIDFGNPSFTSAGGLYMPSIGDQITFLTPNYLIGQGSTFPRFEPIIGGSTLSRYDMAYSIDKNDGDGFSIFKNLYYEKSGGSGVSGQSTFTVTDATGVEIGNHVWGTGISPFAQVTNITSNVITVDFDNITTVSGIIRFNNLPSEVDIDPLLGVKMKWRIITKTINSSPITSLYIQTESTDIGRSNQYPLNSIDLTFIGLITGSDIVILQAGTTNIINSVDSNVGTTSIYTYSTLQSIDIAVYKSGYIPYFIRNYTLGSNNNSLPIAQVLDRNYQ
tara:strand:- start:2452 stop:5544 length:3093 start_codon:yes stop_codon:yes gene_type:complete